MLKQGIAYYRKKGTLDETPVHFDLAAERGRGHAAALSRQNPGRRAGDRLFIADSNHNRIVIARLDGTL